MAARSENAEVRSILIEWLLLRLWQSSLVLTLFQSENGSTGLPDCGDSIDPLTFEQILEMDDDEDERDFSKSIVYGFFDQAEATFRKMDSAL